MPMGLHLLIAAVASEGGQDIVLGDKTEFLAEAIRSIRIVDSIWACHA